MSTDEFAPLDIVLLRPELLWLGLLVLPMLVAAAARLGALGGRRRWAALLLQSLSALLLVGAMAEPALVLPDRSFTLVVVLDASASLSEQSRRQAVDYARAVAQEADAGGNARVQFVAVASQATVLTPEEVLSGAWLTATTPVTGTVAGLAPGHTDLAAGLRMARTLLGDSGRRRVLLVTDGWETRGAAADDAASLAAGGVDLRVVPLTALGEPEVIVTGFPTTPYVRLGDVVQSELHVYSTGPATATLSLSVDGQETTTRRIALQQGENRVLFEQQAVAEGFHTITARVHSLSDVSPHNNEMSATVVVKPRPRVLLLEDRQGEGRWLAAALTSRQIEVEVRGPADVPPQLQLLDVYDAVVLNNVAATSLSLDQQRTLQEYVRRGGRGLVVVGGQTSYAKGGYLESVLEEVLPVSSQPLPRPQKGATALILVLDRSGSMEITEDPTERVTKFAMAKEAARLAVDSLRVGDVLGVIAFDTENTWVVPVQRIAGQEDKDRAKEMISGLPSGAGTSIYPAVADAVRAMRSVPLPNRHIVLLTDGQEWGSPQYEPLLDQMRAEGITLSAIGIGRDADRQLLTRLARLGQGRYYFTERTQNIPRIVFRELELTLKDAVVEGSVQPHVLAPSPLLRGFAPQDLPQLGGYGATTAKGESVVALVADQGDPLLAHWQYGLGRVVAFTSGTGPDWASHWLTWQDFARFWDQAVRWSMASPVNRQLQPTIRLEGDCGPLTSGAGAGTHAQAYDCAPPHAPGVAHISVESLTPDNRFADLADVTAAVRAPSGAITTTLLTQTAPGRYEAHLPVWEPGAYEVRVARHADPASSPSLPTTETAGFVVPPSVELMHAGTNHGLLRRLAGGDAYLDPAQVEAALDPEGLAETASASRPLWGYLLATALVLLLMSVAVRRLDADMGSALRRAARAISAQGRGRGRDRPPDR